MSTRTEQNNAIDAAYAAGISRGRADGKAEAYGLVQALRAIQASHPDGNPVLLHEVARSALKIWESSQQP